MKTLDCRDLVPSRKYFLRVSGRKYFREGTYPGPLKISSLSGLGAQI